MRIAWVIQVFCHRLFFHVPWYGHNSWRLPTVPGSRIRWHSLCRGRWRSSWPYWMKIFQQIDPLYRWVKEWHWFQFFFHSLHSFGRQKWFLVSLRCRFRCMSNLFRKILLLEFGICPFRTIFPCSLWAGREQLVVAFRISRNKCLGPKGSTEKVWTLSEK